MKKSLIVLLLIVTIGLANAEAQSPIRQDSSIKDNRHWSSGTDTMTARQDSIGWYRRTDSMMTHMNRTQRDSMMNIMSASQKDGMIRYRNKMQNENKKKKMDIPTDSMMKPHQ